MRKVFEKAGGKLRERRGSALLSVTPVLCLLFLILAAIVLNAGFLAQKKHELQIIADCAARAGAQAVNDGKCYVVKDDYGWHAYVELDPVGARNNIYRVINAYLSENYKTTSGFTVNTVDWTPVTGHTYPEYDAAAGGYRWREMEAYEMYYNGNCAVELSGTVHTFLSTLSGMEESYPLHAYSAAQAGGRAVRDGQYLPGR